MSLYSIQMLEYAHVPAAPVASVVYGFHDRGMVRLPYGYVLIRNQDRTILVDCGYDHSAHGAKLTALYGVENWQSPADVLGEVGVSVGEVQDIICTHAHFDHIGALSHFPNARVHIQRREIEKAIWAMALGPEFRFLRSATDPVDVAYCLQLAQQGRLNLLDGDQTDLLPGIDVILAADTHTAGSQYVVVRNDGHAVSKDPYVITGDLVYQWENIHGGTPEDPHFLPLGFALGSQTEMVLTASKIWAAAMQDFRRIIAVHEQRISDHSPSRLSSRGLKIVDIAVA